MLCPATDVVANHGRHTVVEAKLHLIIYTTTLAHAVSLNKWKFKNDVSFGCRNLCPTGGGGRGGVNSKKSLRRTIIILILEGVRGITPPTPLYTHLWGLQTSHEEDHSAILYLLLPPLHRNRRIGFKKIIVAHRNNMKWHIMAQNILQLFGIKLIFLNFRWDQYFRRNRHYCKRSQNRKSLVFSKSGQIIIFCEANINNIFSGNGTFRSVYAVNARFSVQRRKYLLAWPRWTSFHPMKHMIYVDAWP